MRALLVIVAACSAPPAQRPPPPPPPADAPVASFTVREVSLRHDGRALDASAQLHSRDRFDFFVDVDGKAFIYVARVAPGGALSVLYPAATAEAIAGNQRIPRDPRQIFQLDDATGDEHLYVLAMTRPLSEGAGAVERAIAALELAAGHDDPAPVTPTTAPIDAGAAPADAAAPRRKPTPKQVAYRELDQSQRNVTLVTTDGSSASCTNMVPLEGVAACRFVVHHVP